MSAPVDHTLGAILGQISTLANTVAELLTDDTAHGREAAERLVGIIGAMADAGRVWSGTEPGLTRGMVAWVAPFLDDGPPEGAGPALPPDVVATIKRAALRPV